MMDGFSDYADSTGAPARHAAIVSPDDTADLSDTPKGLYIGTGGDLVLIPAGAGAAAAGVMFRNLPSGALLPVRARRVLATGTTAGDVVALF